MLNLRTVEPAPATLKTVSTGSTPVDEADTVRFAHGSVLGNIGAPLRTDGFSLDGDLDEEEEVATPREEVEMRGLGEEEKDGEGEGVVRYLAV